MKSEDIPGILIIEDNVYPIKELKNEEFPYYHLQRGLDKNKGLVVEKKVVACKIISITIKDNLNIKAITIQFKYGGKFCIIKDIDKKMFFKLNKKKGDKDYYDPNGESFKINI